MHQPKAGQCGDLSALFPLFTLPGKAWICALLQLDSGFLRLILKLRLETLPLLVLSTCQSIQINQQTWFPLSRACQPCHYLSSFLILGWIWCRLSPEWTPYWATWWARIFITLLFLWQPQNVKRRRRKYRKLCLWKTNKGLIVSFGQSIW